jgi:hypothetical protein
MAWHDMISAARDLRRSQWVAARVGNTKYTTQHIDCPGWTDTVVHAVVHAGNTLFIDPLASAIRNSS